MRFFSLTEVARQRRFVFPLLIVAVSLAGCNAPKAPQKPSLQFTHLPAASAGGPGQLEYIEGRAIGAAPGQQIVLYARSSIWWIQPFETQPFTTIQSDSTWKNSTHLGTEYAALLVESGYHPSSQMVTLPREGNGVIAVASAKGEALRPIVPQVIHFSGYDWTVRIAGSDRGGEPNFYDSANAWVDEKGYLHLAMKERDGVWTCAEVSLNRSLGYGTYRFVVQDSAHLGPSAVVGMFTADDLSTNNTRSEIDIELSRWGNPASKNAQYVVQPFYVLENTSRFAAPPGELTHIFRWEPGTASFNTIRGSVAGPRSQVVGAHVFTSGIPTPATETIHIDLYEFRHSKSPVPHPAEVVIEKFEYLP